MAKKRSREPDEALQQTEKHPRLQERENKSNSEPPQNRRKGHEEKPGRPVPSSHAASQAQLPQPPPIQLPSQRPQLDPEWSDSETSTCYSKDATAYDVRRDEEPDVDPPAEDIEYWRSEKAAKFIGSRSGLDGNWVGVRPLGEGGNGIAGLWELRDHDGQTVKVRIRAYQSITKILTIAEANGSQRRIVQRERVVGRSKRKGCAARNQSHEQIEQGKMPCYNAPFQLQTIPRCLQTPHVHGILSSQ